jgi:hypothetical protein
MVERARARAYASAFRDDDIDGELLRRLTGEDLRELRPACRDQRRRAEARDLLRPVYGRFTEGSDTPDLMETKVLLDEIDGA